MTAALRRPSLNFFYMWYNTRASKLLGVEYPILQGPFGGNLSSVKLASLVSNMGGVGGYGAYTLTPDEIVRLNQELRQATDRPYNINLWVSNSDVSRDGVSDAELDRAKALFEPYFVELGLEMPEKPGLPVNSFEDQVEALLYTKPPVFSFVFGIPSAEILEQSRKKGILIAGGATTLDEAIALEAAGVDLIVASGFEGGGHRPSFLAPAEASLTGTFVLVQQIRDNVRVPVIAAGGIATGKGIAAALALGADGVQIGTAFLACEESGAPAFHRNLLFSDAAKYSVLTRAFSGRLGRGLMSRVAREVSGREKEILPFPLQSRFMSSLRQAAIAREKWELILVWGGQIAPLLTHTKAADLMTALLEETSTYFHQLKN
jgi:nitronate monooxygenase